MRYYKILDLNLIGKQKDIFSCFIYDAASKKWTPDRKKILMDRIMGYDSEVIGCTSVLTSIKEISEEEAMELIR